jgi:ubiquinone/menaquinone biosynthesis C-methylase UbiE
MSVRDPQFYAAWKDEAHAVHFDGLRYIPTPLLVRRWEGFNEVRLLGELLRREPTLTVLEIGCATGEMFRYVSRRHPRATYIGTDISEPAINRAKEKFGARGRFILTDPSLATLDDLKPDIVFCRDVLQHQTEPWTFLRRLYGLAGKALVMRIRTRDKGATEYNAELSCQYHAGSWVPFIMVNVDELVETLSTSFTPPPSRIALVKDYIVLGGHHGRFVPKDCYDVATGTAETAMLVEKSRGDGRAPNVEISARADGEQTPGWLRMQLASRLSSKLVRGFVGRRYAGRTWW